MSWCVCLQAVSSSRGRLQLASVDAAEVSAVAAMVTLVLKLNEAQMRVLVPKTLQWLSEVDALCRQFMSR